ncbi:TPA: LPXTG cell wall anchor domain-containing protein [Streptococcus suis]|uniref:Heme-repressible hemoglobin-binding protein n=2 Tax=Streptococcus suis TaxID=1307 RepID=A0A0Z8JF03_STRSU|nr:LPXTG cell wall anchor domain-containing protein [Streptococcus suis]NQG59853.1 LPXTG cell wall anchor domain-containing protein [Streptococcus suis]NQJ48786.1 LPXTG cell wall anchor domain-containing protein [Streptococcus suis]NQJ55221.1 LPXTG cell wall anchor domain-containing protein [Streptococcus suis]CYV52751.1 Heme-repressible hemoglobin-binding protein [Streptococcus suis]CYV97541.1 Heme-repressible hemoglobin-binding protein [Streptococcus suis]
MNTKKLVKWGVALTSTLVLGGVVAPVGGQLLNAPSVVYAQEKTATANVVSYHPSGVLGQYQDIIPLGGSKTYTAPVFDGWEVYAAGAYSANFSWTVKGVDSVTLPEGFTEESVLVEFYYKPMQIRPTEQPADQPTEQPVEQPTEQPVEKPAETPTDKPVEQLTDASSLTDQTAGKVQAVTATDKKTVDKSAPSTPAVKTEEVSQPVAKTLPKTGDSSSMLLVLGGFLSGLSGLGLAATSRKRD